MNDDLLMEAAMVEIARLKEKHAFVRLDVSVEVLMAVIGALQLAMRHSGFKQRPSYQTVAGFVEGLRGHLRDYPALSELLRRGGLGEYDEEELDG